MVGKNLGQKLKVWQKRSIYLFVFEALLEMTMSEVENWKRMTKSSPLRHVKELNRCRSVQTWQEVELWKQVGQVCSCGCSSSAGSKGEPKVQGSGISRLVKLGPGLIGMGTSSPYDQSPRRGKEGRHWWAL